MPYTIHMKRTVRISVQFDAKNNADAEGKALDLYEEALRNPSRFDGGTVEHDYALCGSHGTELIAWDEPRDYSNSQNYQQ